MKVEKIKPILVRPSPALRKRIEEEAKQQHRSMGNLLIIITANFFMSKDAEHERFLERRGNNVVAAQH